MFEKAVDICYRYRKTAKENTDESFGALLPFGLEFLAEADVLGAEFRQYLYEHVDEWFDEATRRLEKDV